MATLSLFLAAFLVYWRTLAPSITWRNNGADSGDLVSAIFTGGVPHPPGYPLYTALAQLFVALPIGGVAYRVNLFSAAAAAAAVIVLYATIHLVIDVLPPFRWWVAGASALVFAYSPMFWSQATIAEVYALNALLTALLLLGLLLWARDAAAARPSIAPWLVAAALGLGLANHLTILFVVPAAVVLLWRRVGWGSILRVSLVALSIALLLYLTLLLRASSDPPVNWGDPRTLPALANVISGQIYRGYVFGLPLSDYPLRLAAWAKLLFNQFGAIGVALGLWGAVRLFDRAPRIATALALIVAIYSVFAIGYNSVDSDVYLIPAYMAFAIYIAAALGDIVGAVSRRVPSLGWQRTAFPAVVVAGLSLLPLSNLTLNFSGMDISRDTEALDYAQQAFAVMPDNALVVSSDTGEHIFSLWYYRYVERPDSHVLIVVPGLLDFPWYRQELKRHNPTWVWSQPPPRDWLSFLETFIANNKERHPVFWAERDPLFEKTYSFTPAGPIYRVAVP